MEINTGIIKVVFVCIESKLPDVFIFIEATWFFPTNVYLHETMKRAFHTHADEMDMHECLSRPFFNHAAALYTFVFPFHSLLAARKNSYVYTSLFTKYFFLSMSQYSCSNDIVRIHHIFSLLVYIIFPLSSEPSLIHRFMYAYLKGCCFSVFFQ
jgi:hypothetical protein